MKDTAATIAARCEAQLTKLAARLPGRRAAATAQSTHTDPQLPGGRFLARRRWSALVMGCGIGGSGSQVLAKLLSGCRGVRCAYEERPLLPWTDEPPLTQQRLSLVLSESDDVAFSWLPPHIPSLVANYPNIRIIVTRSDALDMYSRSTEARISNGAVPGRHYWLHPNGEEPAPVLQRNAYPNARGIGDRDQAFVAYCTKYDAAIDELKAAHPDNFLIVPTEELSNRRRQDEIFAFAGIPEHARRYRDETGQHHSR